MTVTESTVLVDCMNCDFSGDAVETDDPQRMWRSWTCPVCGVEYETSGAPDWGRLDVEDPDAVRELWLDERYG